MKELATKLLRTANFIGVVVVVFTMYATAYSFQYQGVLHKIEAQLFLLLVTVVSVSYGVFRLVNASEEGFKLVKKENIWFKYIDEALKSKPINVGYIPYVTLPICIIIFLVTNPDQKLVYTIAGVTSLNLFMTIVLTMLAFGYSFVKS